MENVQVGAADAGGGYPDDGVGGGGDLGDGESFDFHGEGLAVELDSFHGLVVAVVGMGVLHLNDWMSMT